MGGNLREAPARPARRRGGGGQSGMVLGITLEPLIVLTAVFASIGLLVVIDRLGTLRRGDLQDEEEDI